MAKSKKERVVLERAVMQLSPPPNDQKVYSQFQPGIQEQILNLEDYLESEFVKYTEATKRKLPKIKFRYDSDHVFTNSFNVISVHRLFKSIRIIIRCNNEIPELNKQEIQHKLTENNISHVVEIIPSELFPQHPEGWFGSDFYSCSIYTPINKILPLIADIMIDIAIYNQHHLLKPSTRASIRHKASMEKVKFAEQISSKTHYGPINQGDIRYVCFASIFRTKNGINYVDLSKTWNDFACILFNKENNMHQGDIKDHHELAKRMGQKIVGHINLTQLKKHFDRLESGYWFYAEIIKKPTSHHVQRQLEALFGNKGCKIGRFRFFEARQFVALRSCVHVLLIISFNK